MPSTTAAAATSRMATSAVSKVTVVAARRRSRRPRAVRGNASGIAGRMSTDINLLLTAGISGRVRAANARRYPAAWRRNVASAGRGLVDALKETR